MSDQKFERIYAEKFLSRVAFPLGGMGAGMVCLEGSGAISHVSVRNEPDIFHEPLIFGAVRVEGDPAGARVLEGPVPTWKIFGQPGSALGNGGTAMGMPRFEHAEFAAAFPFGTVRLFQPNPGIGVEIQGWSPFAPGADDDASLPLAILEYRVENREHVARAGVFSFHAQQFFKTDASEEVGVVPIPGGFILRSLAPKLNQRSEFAVALLGDEIPSVDCAWFRGHWFDALSLVWNKVLQGDTTAADPPDSGPSSPGGSLYKRFHLAPGESRRIRILLAWYVPDSDVRYGANRARESVKGTELKTYTPWYSGRFGDVREIVEFASANYGRLRESADRFRESFFDTTLPGEVVDAVSANLSILKSPTVLRQTDGRIWLWEGCADSHGSCHGSCTHVWNYAQAIAHLFPRLERTLRQSEFLDSLDDRGHQNFRTAMPIRPVDHLHHAAADGQLGGIMKVFRDWRILGDTAWLRNLWPRVLASLEYCISTWDPDRQGILSEPHHNTYDIEFWGPDGMCQSYYLGALVAAQRMAEALGAPVDDYASLYTKGRRFMEQTLFNGEYFEQQVRWPGSPNGSIKDLDGSWTTSLDTLPEARQLFESHGPKYQYGSGCLSDGVVGAWLAIQCGLGHILDPTMLRSHLLSVHRYNLRHDLRGHSNPQRPGYAMGSEGGLLLCSWPKGDQPPLPFVYSNEVWTGIEYQVASHLMAVGCISEGLEIVRTARKRYDGCIRNPFDEYECGHWYGRALASYGLLFGLTGVRYDAVDRELHVAPSLPGDFRTFLSTNTGYGTAGVRDGTPFLEVVSGTIDCQNIRFHPWSKPPDANETHE